MMVLMSVWKRGIMIQKTSLEAYNVIKPDLGRMQNIIYNIIKMYPNVSNLDISRFLSKPINSVTPRVKELRDRGLVVHWKYKTDRITKRKVMTWRVVE